MEIVLKAVVFQDYQLFQLFLDQEIQNFIDFEVCVKGEIHTDVPVSSDASCPVCHSQREWPNNSAPTELLTYEGASCKHSFLQSSASATGGAFLCISALSLLPMPLRSLTPQPLSTFQG